MRLVVLALLLGGAVTAAAKPPPPAASRPAPPAPLWIGVFDPGLPPHPPWSNARLSPVAHGGVVRVLSPASGPPASGDVVIVHPLLGKTATGKLDRGSVAIADFAFDQRDGDDGVLVLPAGTPVVIVAPGKADAMAIKTTLVRTEALAGVRRSVDGIELGGVDVDGDGQADIVATYGCTAWFDGACQSHGQFVLARRGARWVIVE